MARFEVLADVDVKRLDNTGFTHYYGKKPGHKGQLIDDKIISNHDMDVLRSRGALGEQVAIAVEPEVSLEEPVSPIGENAKKDKFGKEIYFCAKCGKNHRVESKIGKDHRE